jgi:ribosome-binding protein aMBF1 (putative translation factor)
MTATTTTTTTILLFCKQCGSETRHVRFDIAYDGSVILVCCNCRLINTINAENVKTCTNEALVAAWKNMLNAKDGVVDIKEQ